MYLRSLRGTGIKCHVNVFYIDKLSVALNELVFYFQGTVSERLFNMHGPYSTTPHPSTSVIAQQLANPPLGLHIGSQIFNMNQVSQTQPISLNPPPEYSASQMTIARPENQFHNVTSLPITSLPINSSLAGTLQVSQIDAVNGNLPSLPQYNFNPNSHASAMPSSNIVKLPSLSSSFLNQVNTLGQVPTFQLVTDQGTFNIQSIIPDTSPVEIQPAQCQQISNTGGQTFVPVLRDSHPAAEKIVSVNVQQTVEDTNYNSVAPVQILYMVDGAQSLGSHEVTGLKFGDSLTQATSTLESNPRVLTVNSGCETVISASVAQPVALENSAPVNIVELKQDNAGGVKHGQVTTHGVMLEQQPVVQQDFTAAPLSAENQPSHLHITYETKSGENGQPMLQQIFLPHGDVVTLSLDEVAASTESVKPVESVNSLGVTGAHDEGSANEEVSKVLGSKRSKNTPKIITKKTKNSQSRPRVGKSQTKTNPGKSQNGTMTESRNLSNALNVSKQSISSHAALKVTFEDLNKTNMKVSQAADLEDIPVNTKVKSRQFSGNSDMDGRSRKSSGNSLISEISGLTPSNLSSPNLFHDKIPFVISNIEGMDLSEIEASPSWEEMYQTVNVERPEVDIETEDHQHTTLADSGLDEHSVSEVVYNDKIVDIRNMKVEQHSSGTKNKKSTEKNRLDNINEDMKISRRPFQKKRANNKSQTSLPTM